MRRWWNRNVMFISWGKYWKGVYIHFLPWYYVRIYLWNIDWTEKRPKQNMVGRTGYLFPPPKCNLKGEGE